MWKRVLPFCRRALPLRNASATPSGVPAVGRSQLGLLMPRDDPAAGRSWRISELRLKSQEDLHKLWYVLWVERNMLKTEWAFARSKGNTMRNPARIKKVRNSMARLKTVLGERSRQVKAYKAEQDAIRVKDMNAIGHDQNSRYIAKRMAQFEAGEIKESAGRAKFSIPEGSKSV